jgi:hypothetical protein
MRILAAGYNLRGRRSGSKEEPPMIPLRETVGALALGLVLAGCNQAPPPPPTFTLWEISDVYVSGLVGPHPRPARTVAVAIEGNLDRVACELLQSKRAAAWAASGDTRALLSGDFLAADYRCLPTGTTPDTTTRRE